MRFRVWDKENKIMLAVNNICNLFWDSKFIEGYELVPDPKGKQEYDLIDHRIDFADVILMQSTGIFDNSTPKKEIFEGDILKCTSINGRLWHETNVSWDSTIAGFAIHKNIYEATSIGYLTDSKTITVEIIGNIYQNPELVEDK